MSVKVTWVMAGEPEFVGRQSELVRLEDEFSRARRGKLRIVLIVADPGVGKTRLAGELFSRARRRAIGMQARAFPLGATASFALWIEALEGYLRDLDADHIRSLCGGYLDDLAGLLRSVAAVRGSAPGSEPPRLRLMEGLAVLLRNVAQERPTIVFLDDVHLADASSWQTLSYLAGALRTEPLLVVAAARPAEMAAEPVAVESVLRLEQDGVLSRLELGPLEEHQVGELASTLLGRPAPRSLSAWLFGRSRGTPLFALGLLHALVDEGADLEHPELSSLPEGLTDRVVGRLRALGPDSRSTLETLAVIGRRVDLYDLQRLSEQPLEQLGSTIEHLVAARLVLEDRGRFPRYEIAHPLIQEAIYQSVGGARRAALHRRMGRSLLAAGKLGESAMHYARSAEAGDDEAIDALVAAMKQAESFDSHLEAMEILEALTELVPSGDHRWLRVLEAMSVQPEWVLDHRGGARAVEGVKALREIERLLESSGERSRLSAVKFRLGVWLAWSVADVEEARRNLRDALELFEAAGASERALLARSEIALLVGMAGDLEEWEHGSADVAEAARRQGMGLVEVYALGLLGIAQWFRGKVTEAEETLTRSLAISRREGKLYRVTWNLAHLAEVAAFDGRVDEAQTMIREATEADPDHRAGILPPWKVIVAWLAGDLAEAIRTADEIMLLNPKGLDSRHLFAASYACVASVERGDFTRARVYLDAFRKVPIGDTWFGVHGLVDWSEGVLEARVRSVPEGLTTVAQAARSLWSFDAIPYAVGVWADAAELAWEAADAEVAAEATAGIREAFARRPHPMIAALGSLADGYAALAGVSELRADELREAVEAFAAAGWTMHKGRALDALGRLSGDRDGAIASLEKAVGIFEERGAAFRRDRALDLLGSLGTKGRRAASTVTGAGSLTRRENEVVTLALEGLTAREIGERLFIGERTVETHIGNAYAKLGVASRVELLRRATELGLTRA